MLAEPRSGLLVAWGNALLTGNVPPDDAVSEIVGTDEPHRVTGVPGEPVPVGLSLALGRLRALGVTGLRLALPVSGDPLALPGPPTFNDLALHAGEAAVTVGAPGTAYGLVPSVTTHGPAGDTTVRVAWTMVEVSDRPAPGPFLAEAERELAEAMRDATDDLLRLDVAASGPAAQRALAALYRKDSDIRVVPGRPGRAGRVLDQARRIHAVLAVASGEDGAAVTAAEISARLGALAPLERACRRAMVAAYGAALEPDRA
ncbi:hypothetical protein [Streptomyces sp. SID3343]|uniref:hypothetical protein n=1 Tax=Streptomyces sp. SID3343 TaxID=2690260 RepID=UPI0013687032|nr:hypothetical protein [Streptomyces sp. SID3343]MYW00407.1 hypothetical protein [Streptomyces sp. SID3343]